MTSTLGALRRGFVTAVAVFAAVGGIGLAVAGDQVPFKGAASSPGVYTVPGEPAYVRHADYTGNVTHLGAITVHQTYFILGIGPVNGHIGFYGVFDATLTAANGDKLFESGSFATYVDTGALWEVHAHGDVVGGTGRFEGATGSGEISGTQIPADPSPLTVTVEGTISSVGSAKH
jgi:hypothetical protein